MVIIKISLKYFYSPLLPFFHSSSFLSSVFYQNPLNHPKHFHVYLQLVYSIQENNPASIFFQSLPLLVSQVVFIASSLSNYSFLFYFIYLFLILYLDLSYYPFLFILFLNFFIWLCQVLVVAYRSSIFLAAGGIFFV